ncbi:ATP-binding cassette domain-containing protein [Paracoccus sp. S-4012]|uniref:ABC transporter ATP-binding protein n=1 Tax=Paracoccus sp. S-4012 TaxID=2665648 RepID=UPI0012AF6EB8|nr:ABC transporter ATP-binding protein [Paracoccus sp. S-4012]MRX49670.1 ATP-binding cassette domain-containing protein [Paracoccus sp. S-4012]
MIRLEHVTKRYRARGVTTIVADDISATFPTGVSVGLLGRNGAGKSSLLRMIAGTMRPTSGRIWSDGTLSWPVGFAGSFHGDLTGAQNVRFVARIYGVDTDELEAYVRAFANIGPHFDRPFFTYSSGMRSRLAFGTSMGIDFDTYLVDEVTSVGDGDFRLRSEQVFLDRMRGAGAVVVSHSMPMMRNLCTMGAVLHDARLTFFDDIDEAIAMHEDLLGIPRSRRILPGAAPPQPGAMPPVPAAAPPGGAR